MWLEHNSAENDTYLAHYNNIEVSITVRHYAPATSKWNKTEHRMFSFVIRQI
ncbi:MAG: hypothetical protein HQK53_06715 [Oligoflexia bacterium]|nr:hypothetical protein [Oligoflexia bacterium]